MSASVRVRRIHKAHVCQSLKDSDSPKYNILLIQSTYGSLENTIIISNISCVIIVKEQLSTLLG